MSAESEWHERVAATIRYASCLIGLHDWHVTRIDYDARPPVKILRCQACGSEAPIFHDDISSQTVDRPTQSDVE
jgi:hypothetical protein